MFKLKAIIAIVSVLGIFGSIGLLFWSMAEDDGWIGIICSVFFMGFAYLFLKLLIN